MFRWIPESFCPYKVRSGFVLPCFFFGIIFIVVAGNCNKPLQIFTRFPFSAKNSNVRSISAFIYPQKRPKRKRSYPSSTGSPVWPAPNRTSFRKAEFSDTRLNTSWLSSIPTPVHVRKLTSILYGWVMLLYRFRRLQHPRRRRRLGFRYGSRVLCRCHRGEMERKLSNVLLRDEGGKKIGYFLNFLVLDWSSFSCRNWSTRISIRTESNRFSATGKICWSLSVLKRRGTSLSAWAVTARWFAGWKRTGSTLPYLHSLQFPIHPKDRGERRRFPDIWEATKRFGRITTRLNLPRSTKDQICTFLLTRYAEVLWIDTQGSWYAP